MKNYFNMRLMPSSNPTNIQLPMLLLYSLTYLVFTNTVWLMASASPSSVDRNKENAVQPTPPAMSREEDMTKAILDELQREGHTTKKDITPSKKFMIDLFSSLRREEILQNKSDHLPPKTRIHHSDTVRSFSAKVPSSSRHYRRNRLFYEFFIPVLPEHERAHVVEFRVLNSNVNAYSTTSPFLVDTPLGSRSRRARRAWAVVVKKDGVRIYKDTRRYRPIKEGMYDVFDVTEAVASYLNDNRGNLIIVIKERARDESDDDDQEERDSSDPSSCASPGNGLLVLYSRNSHFFHDVYQRFTTGSSPTIAEHRQRRHSQVNGSQHRRLRPRQREKNRKNRKSTEKDKQTKRNKSKSHEIPCGRYDYTIDFDVIGWGKWIVAPKKFNAHLCSGSCAFHIEAKHNSSNHAMLQSLMRLKQPEITPMPCCVPTKLRSISMMYFELGEIVVRKHQDVIAEECGCR